MKLDYIFKKYQQHHWVEEEGAASIHTMDPWRTCYLDGKDIFKGFKGYSFCIFLLEKNRLYEWSSFEEGKRVLTWMIDKYKKDRRYWQKKDKEYRSVNQQIDDMFYFFCDTDIKKFGNQQLRKYIKQLMRLGNLQFGYNLIAEGMDVVDDNYYRNLLPNVSEDKLLDIIGLMSTPDDLTFLEKEHLDILRLARAYYKFKKLPDQFYKDLAKHQHNYFWIQNNYQGAKEVKISYFQNELDEIFSNINLAQINQQINYLEHKKIFLSRKRKLAQKRYKLSKESRHFFSLLRLLAGWQDRRKENIQKILSAIDKIFFVIYQRFKVPKVILREYFIQEINNLLLTGRKVTDKELNKRRIIMFYNYLDKSNNIKKQIFYGQAAIEAKQYFQRHNQLDVNQGLSGFVASRGMGQTIIRGKARIVLSAHGAKFNKGEILVTGMTRPEFVPLMKRAKAIITNEGGITTHAAIISRELKIPCIIGTKVATEVFKTGDTVELDLKQGIIKKI